MTKLYKYKNRVICYIMQSGDVWRVCTGKPSDRECLAWKYNNYAEAEKTAVEYYNNYINI
jgi:hypothetical protein